MSAASAISAARSSARSIITFLQVSSVRRHRAPGSSISACCSSASCSMRPAASRAGDAACGGGAARRSLAPRAVLCAGRADDRGRRRRRHPDDRTGASLLRSRSRATAPSCACSASISTPMRPRPGSSALALLAAGIGCGRLLWPRVGDAWGAVNAQSARKGRGMSAALSLHDLRKSFGVTPIIRGVSLEIAAGERHAIIGPNGAGKTTLFHLDQRALQAERRRGASQGRAHQRSLSLRDQPSRPVAQLPGHQHLSQIVGLRKPALRGFVVARPQICVLDRHRPACATSAPARNELMERIGLSARRDVPAGVLTYAEQRALEIGVTIGGDADVILLDEPTAGMSKTETEQAVALIRKVTRGQDAGDGRARHERRLRPRRPHFGAGLWPGDRQRHARTHPRRTRRCRKPISDRRRH